MTMSKALPIGAPLAYGYQLYAYPLSILATDPVTEDWVLSNFVQVWHDRRGSDAGIPFSFHLHDYALCPWLDVIRMTRSWVNADARDFTELLCDAVDRGYYPYLVVDEFHVPNREAHQSRSFPHDILVHGYDEQAQEFDVLGFDEHFRYRSTRVRFADLHKSHTSMDDHGEVDSPFYFFRLRDGDRDPSAQQEQPAYPGRLHGYPFDLALVRQSTSEYLAAEDSARHFAAVESPSPWNRAYGVATYPYLAEHLREHAAGARYDIRRLHVLWEHKRLSVLRMRRAAQFRPAVGALLPAAEKLAESANALRNAMIRDHLVGRRAGFLPGALAQLELIETMERALLTEFAGLLA